MGKINALALMQARLPFTEPSITRFADCISATYCAAALSMRKCQVDEVGSSLCLFLTLGEAVSYALKQSVRLGQNGLNT